MIGLVQAEMVARALWAASALLLAQTSPPMAPPEAPTPPAPVIMPAPDPAEIPTAPVAPPEPTPPVIPAGPASAPSINPGGAPASAPPTNSSPIPALPATAAPPAPAGVPVIPAPPVAVPVLPAIPVVPTPPVATPAPPIAPAANTLSPADLAAVRVDSLWGQEPVEELTSKRGRICLNGVWNFLPVEGAAAQEPLKDANAWGQIPVPGSWNNQYQLPKILALGQGDAWKDFAPARGADAGNETGAVWYERLITVPAAWAGRAILLDLSRVSTDAIVYVNGAECGKIEWPAGTVDITGQVTPGQPALLHLKVIAADDAKQVLISSGADQATRAAARLSARGIIGEVFLTSRPRAAYVSDVFVQTSTRHQELALDIELTGVSTARPVNFTAQLVDEDGKVEQTFTKEVTIRSEPLITTRVSWSWPSPRIWDVGQPNLYTLRLKAETEGLDDEYAVTFGFREFWIDGRDFFLNGTKLHLRPATLPGEEFSPLGGHVASMDAVFDGLASYGFNYAEEWPWDTDRRGRVHFRDLWSERADKKGMLLGGGILSMAPYMFGPGWTTRRWDDDPALTARFKKRLEAEVRRLRNHPSIIMWGMTGQSLDHPQDQDPRNIGKKNLGVSPEYRGRQKVADQGVQMVYQIDPTRPVFVHAGSSAGAVYTANTYLDFIPLQEREDWLSEWSTGGEMPFQACEFGTPFTPTFLRGRDGFAKSVQTEPWMTEFAAIYLGRRAYQLEEDAYRAELAKMYKGGQEYGFWQGNAALEGAAAFQEIQSLFIRNTWRSWRTWGVSGGMVPWNLAQGWIPGAKGRQMIPQPVRVAGQRGTYLVAQQASLIHFLQADGNERILPAADMLKAVNGPTLAYIAGPAEAFTAKDHNFNAGDEVKKQVALINDTRAAQPYRATWSVQLGGKPVAQEEKTGTLAPGAIAFLPITFTLPKTMENGVNKSEGRINLRADIGGAQHEDAFTFRAFASPAATPAPAIALWDPVGETTQMLVRLGIPATPWDGKAVSGLLIVGRKVLSAHNTPPGDLAAFVKAGGNLLIMAQDPQWISTALNLRVAPTVSRRVFPETSPAAVAVANGLDEADLTNWNGAGTLLNPFPPTSPQDATPLYGWRWGNRNSVASVPIETPHMGAFTPLLSCEFDLAYTPLLQLQYGKGCLWLCTLDLEDAAPVDPAARLLTQNLLGYAANPASATYEGQRVPSARGGKTIFLGPNEDAKLLDDLGVIYEKAGKVTATNKALTSLSPGTLVLVGKGEPESAALTTYLKAENLKTPAGASFLLPRPVGQPTVGGVVSQVDAFHGAPESIFRWRADGVGAIAPPSTASLSVAPGAFFQQFGLAGRVANNWYCQADPRVFPEDKTYFRFSRWRATQALSRTLTAAGATFKQDEVFMAQLKQPEAAISLAGDWEVQMTTFRPQSDKREWNNDTGVSAEAKGFLLGSPIKSGPPPAPAAATPPPPAPAPTATNAPVAPVSDKKPGSGKSKEKEKPKAKNKAKNQAGDAKASSTNAPAAPTPAATNAAVEPVPATPPPPPRLSIAGSNSDLPTVPPPSPGSDITPGWKLKPVPALFESYGGSWATADGEVVYRKQINIPAAWAGRDLILSLGRVDDSDITFFNNEQVGAISGAYEMRRYTIPGAKVKAGAAMIVIRVWDKGGEGGGLCGHPEEMYLAPKTEDKNFYSRDYLDDFKMGDNPYRYFRW